ncbi:MAG: 5-oxoprolinase subunit PxpA [Pseudomonadota bacterium]
MSLDLNCDLGEWEHPARTRALMRLIDSANVACGGHAGDLDSMVRCVRLASEFGVRLGAHPGHPAGDGFGRREAPPTPSQLALWVVQQAGALARLAARHGMALHHVKLHGALYHASEADADLARAYVAVMREHFPGVAIYALSGGRVVRAARRAGIEAWDELFADRGYGRDGRLIPRDQPGALLGQPRAVLERLDQWLRTGRMATHASTDIALAGDTLCLHGDGDAALVLAAAVRRHLGPRPDTFIPE